MRNLDGVAREFMSQSVVQSSHKARQLFAERQFNQVVLQYVCIVDKPLDPLRRIKIDVIPKYFFVLG